MPEPSLSSTACVLVVDDLADIRHLLRTVLRLEAPWLDVVEAVDGEHALRIIEATQPDVVVIDLAMPRLDGLAAIPRISERSPGTRVVVFSAFPAATMGARTRAVGAHAYHEKTGALDEMVSTITLLAAGEPTPERLWSDAAGVLRTGGR